MIQGQLSRMSKEENTNFIPAQIPIKLVIVKSKSGTTLNGVEIKHIKSAEEIVGEIKR